MGTFQDINGNWQKKKKTFYEFDTRISINNMLWGQMYMSVGT